VPKTKSPLLRRLVGWTGGGSTTTDARAFLQERITLYMKTLFFYTAGFYVLGRVGIYLATGSLETTWAMTLETAALLHLGLVLAIGFDWWFMCSATRALWLLHAYESVGTISVCATFAAMIYYMPDDLPTAGLLIATALTIVIRAALDRAGQRPARLQRTRVAGRRLDRVGPRVHRGEHAHLARHLRPAGADARSDAARPVPPRREDR
jgi:hypothetical protein